MDETKPLLRGAQRRLNVSVQKSKKRPLKEPKPSTFIQGLMQNPDFVNLYNLDIEQVEQRRKNAERYFLIETGTDGSKTERFFQGPRNINSLRNNHVGVQQTDISRRPHTSPNVKVDTNCDQSLYKTDTGHDKCIDTQNSPSSFCSSKTAPSTASSKGSISIIAREEQLQCSRVNFRESETLLQKAFLLKSITCSLDSNEALNLKEKLYYCYIAQGKNQEAQTLLADTSKHIEQLDSLGLFNPSRNTKPKIKKKNLENIGKGNLRSRYLRSVTRRFGLVSSPDISCVRVKSKRKAVAESLYKFEMSKQDRKDPMKCSLEEYMYSLAEYPKWKDFKIGISICCPKTIILGTSFTISYKYSCSITPERTHKHFDRVAIFKNSSKTLLQSVSDGQSEHKDLVAWHYLIVGENEGSLRFSPGCLKQPGLYSIKYLLHGSMFHVGDEYTMEVKHPKISLLITPENLSCGDPIKVSYKYELDDQIKHCKQDWIGVYPVEEDVAKGYGADSRTKSFTSRIPIAKALIPETNSGCVLFSQDAIKSLLPGEYLLHVHSFQFENCIIGSSKPILLRTKCKKGGQYVLAPRLTREIRLCLCSPAGDFQTERGIIRKQLFDVIRPVCDQLRLSFTVIDLMEATYFKETKVSNGKTKRARHKQIKWNDTGIQVLLEEVNQCYPDIIYMAGDRYGLMLPENILRSLKTILPWLPNYQSHLTTVSNGIPGRERHDFYPKLSLYEALVAAGYFIPWSQGESLTRSSFFYRHPVLKTKDPELLKSQYEPDQHDTERSALAMKEDIENSGAVITKDFSSSRGVARRVCDTVLRTIIENYYMEGDIPDELDIITLRCNAFAQTLKWDFKRHMANRYHETHHNLGKIGQKITEYVSQLRRGNSLWDQHDRSEMADLNTELNVPENGVKTSIPNRFDSSYPLILVGPDDSGKSTELILWLDNYINSFPKQDGNLDNSRPGFFSNISPCISTLNMEGKHKTLVIAHFMGVIPELQTAEQVLFRTMMEAKYRFDIDDNDFIVPNGNENILNLFPAFLTFVEKKNSSIILVVDNINLMKTLKQDKEGLDYLWFLPKDLDPSVFIIIGSCASNTKEYEAEIGQKAWNKIYLKPQTSHLQQTKLVKSEQYRLENEEKGVESSGDEGKQAFQRCEYQSEGIESQSEECRNDNGITDKSSTRSYTQQRLYDSGFKAVGLKDMVKILLNNLITKHPKAHDILCLIQCSYFGITEYEIMEITGLWKGGANLRTQWSLIRKELLENFCYNLCGAFVYKSFLIESVVSETLFSTPSSYKKWLKILLAYFEKENERKEFSHRTAQEYPHLIIRLLDMYMMSHIRDTKYTKKLLGKLEDYLFSDVKVFFDYWLNGMPKYNLYGFLNRLKINMVSELPLRLLKSLNEAYGITDSPDCDLSDNVQFQKQNLTHNLNVSTQCKNTQSGLASIVKGSKSSGSKLKKITAFLKRYAALSRTDSVIDEGAPSFSEFNKRCPEDLVQLALLCVECGDLKKAQLFAEFAILVCWRVDSWDALGNVMCNPLQERALKGEIFISTSAKCIRCLVEIINLRNMELNHLENLNQYTKKSSKVLNSYFGDYSTQDTVPIENCTSFHSFKETKGTVSNEIAKLKTLVRRTSVLDIRQRSNVTRTVTAFIITSSARVQVCSGLLKLLANSHNSDIEVTQKLLSSFSY